MNTDNSKLLDMVRALPKMPVVAAKDMVYAQGYRPSEADREAIEAHIRFSIACGSADPSATVQVVDVYTGAYIGTIRYGREFLKVA